MGWCCCREAAAAAGIRVCCLLSARSVMDLPLSRNCGLHNEHTEHTDSPSFPLSVPRDCTLGQRYPGEGGSPLDPTSAHTLPHVL